MKKWEISEASAIIDLLLEVEGLDSRGSMSEYAKHGMCEDALWWVMKEGRMFEVQLASNSAISDDVLESLLDSPNPSVLEALLSNPRITVGAIHDVIEMLDAKHLRAIACRTDIHPEAIRALATDSDYVVRGTLAHNQCTPLTVLELLASDNSSFVRIGVAGNPSSSASLLSEMATDSEAEVQLALATNENTPPHILEQLALSPERKIKVAVLANKNKPESIGQ